MSLINKLDYSAYYIGYLPFLSKWFTLNSNKNTIIQ